MFSTLMVSEANAVAVTNGEQGVRPPEPGTQRWLDVEAPTAEELVLLRERFDLHPVAIDDCARFDQRPKLEEYSRQLFVVTHQLHFDAASAGVTSRELHAFLGDGYLITIHEQPLRELASVRERWRAEPSLRQRSLAYAYYLVCERIVTSNFDTLEHLFEAIEDIEDAVLKREDDDALPELFAAKRRLAGARRVLLPQREVMALLLESSTPFVDERARPYFRRVLDLLIRMTETLDTQREILSNVLDAHLSIVSNRTNAIMKSLTLLSAIFLPLGFVTGFFGQNFEHLPFKSDLLMWLGIALCVLIPASMLYWFKSQKWL